MTSSLVIQTSFLGDMVLTTPLLAEVAKRGSVDVVSTPAAAGLLANHPAVRRVIVYDKRGGDRGAGGVWRLARALARSGYDAAYLAQGSMRSAALARLAGIPVRVGFATSSGRALYTQRVAYREERHHAERLLALALGANAEPARDAIRPRLYPGPEEDRDVDELLRAVGWSAEPLIALAPGSVWGTKRWPAYAQLARELRSQGRVVIVGGAADRELARAILDASADAIDATGRVSLLASAALIARCAVMVTNDSLPEHLASAVGTPTVAIFGPTVPAFGFGPLAPRAETIGLDALRCRPCDRHGPQRCPLGHWKCMREVSVATVAAAARRVMR